MKRCTRCGVEKPEERFSKQSRQKDGLSPWCKDCFSEYRNGRRNVDREYQKLYYRKHNETKKQYRKDKLEQIHKLKNSCVKCGESRPYAIDFHHIDPKTKEFEPSQLINASNQKLSDELKKCICLCRNCHAEFHYWYGNKPKEPVKALNEYLGVNPYELTVEIKSRVMHL